MTVFRTFVATFVMVGALPFAGHAGEAKTLNVSCDAGDTIGAALAKYAQPGRALTVNITGTCTENVVVTADDTTLRGSGGAMRCGSLSLLTIGIQRRPDAEGI